MLHAATAYINARINRYISGTYARIAPRSGLSAKYSIDVGAGVVNEDYQRPIKILLINHSSNSFQVNTGDRIAQLILECIQTPKPVPAKSLT